MSQKGFLSAQSSPISWMPALSGGTGVTYGERAGLYLQIGRMVFFNFSMLVTSKGTTEENVALNVTGLPVAPMDFSDEDQGFAVSGNFTPTPSASQLFSGTAQVRNVGDSFSFRWIRPHGTFSGYIAASFSNFVLDTNNGTLFSGTGNFLTP